MEVLAHSVDKGYGKDHQDGDDEEDNLAPFLHFAAKDDGIEAALLEACSAILMMMVVVVMFRHRDG